MLVSVTIPQKQFRTYYFESEYEQHGIPPHKRAPGANRKQSRIAITNPKVEVKSFSGPLLARSYHCLK